MSYCRWSSDDFGCDLYCYEDVSGGWTTHVASNRVVGDVPKIPWDPELMERDKEAWSKTFLSAHKAQTEFIKTAKRKNIGLPHDGESFNDPTLEEFLERLLYLRKVGYKFPDSVLDAIREEIAEQ